MAIATATPPIMAHETTKIAMGLKTAFIFFLIKKDLTYLDFTSILRLRKVKTESFMNNKLLLSFIILIFAFPAFSSKKILIIGDSLTEGYGVNEEFSFPSVLESILISKKLDYKVINGGVSGSTTASGQSRLKWFLKAKPEILIIALGANDGLRGIKIEKTRKNLEVIIKMAQDKKIKTVLAGMQLPPNYGKQYTQDFKKLFISLVKKYKLQSIPFLLEGVAGKKELNIEDGIHPNRAGYKVIAKNVFENIKDLL